MGATAQYMRYCVFSPFYFFPGCVCVWLKQIIYTTYCLLFDKERWKAIRTWLWGNKEYKRVIKYYAGSVCVRAHWGICFSAWCGDALCACVLLYGNWAHCAIVIWGSDKCGRPRSELAAELEVTHPHHFIFMHTLKQFRAHSLRSLAATYVLSQ